jgi:hypothetical protein
MKTVVKIDGLAVRQKAGESPFEGKVAAVTGFAAKVGMVTSHSCDIDRGFDVLMLEVLSLSALSGQVRAALLESGALNGLLLLPASDRLPACALDLNKPFVVANSWLGKREKYKSPKRNGADEQALIPLAEVVALRFASLSVDGISRQGGGEPAERAGGASLQE